MSKSLGNVVAPQSIIEESGADILRLWVATTDYTEDMRIGPEIVKGLVDNYRRLRNTFRFLLGNLSNFEEVEQVRLEEMPELERWVLHRLSELDNVRQTAIEDYTFHVFYNSVHNFCATDLSAFYFDVRKDSLYCDSLDSVRRRATRTVLDQLFSILTRWLAPALPFTSEEAWLSRFPTEDDSVHLQLFPELPEEWHDAELANRWERLRDLRRVITGALEVERIEKRIGSSLEASVCLYLTEPSDVGLVDAVDMAELSISSQVWPLCQEPPVDAFTLNDVQGVAVTVEKPAGRKCDRCWQHLSSVGSHAEHPDLCGRCFLAVQM